MQSILNKFQLTTIEIYRRHEYVHSLIPIKLRQEAHQTFIDNNLHVWFRL